MILIPHDDEYSLKWRTTTSHSTTLGSFYFRQDELAVKGTEDSSINYKHHLCKEEIKGGRERKPMLGWPKEGLWVFLQFTPKLQGLNASPGVEIGDN